MVDRKHVEIIQDDWRVLSLATVLLPCALASTAVSTLTLGRFTILGRKLGR